MEDRGEKIVTLARAILHNPGQTADVERGYYSLKTVLLAAALSAAGASVSTGCMVEYFRPLNRYEKVELLALIQYAAQIRHIKRDTIQADFFKDFGIRSLDELTLARMQAARVYLQKEL
ncbi:MAG: hypothetical protein WBK91_07000 [Alphaproteobacteria bacterium]